MTVKEAYKRARDDELMSLIIVIEVLLQYGKIKMNEDSCILNFYLCNGKDKWNILIKKEMMKRGIAA
ncbi:hypothetical protein DPQ31_16170 [Bacillus sp. COPE52]|nr:hypothetical protein DPQ31_16170 [Bacillus sp. COPE52]